MSQVPSITLNDGNTIPQLGIGVWQVSESDIVPSLTKAFEVGYRHVDTAAAYGNEEGVGQAIRQSGLPREELFITTKLWNDRHTDARKAVEESLSKLGLDYLDLYLIHWPVPAKDEYLTAWRALEQIKADGLAKSIGVCNFNPGHLAKIIDGSDTVPAVNQIEIHPTLTQTAVVEDDKRLGIATESWTPLGGKEDLENPTIVAIADRLGKTAAQVIIRWHLQHGFIVFPKSVTPERIEQNFDVFNFELTDEDMAAIDGLNADRRTGPDPETFGA
ncbi:aldo/keto reductase [Nakamurella aerolata]|uniref:Aldo/keto reductase n=1 Tax=Nakamurella aerolata TaxID=1656892 RepID=A0A849A7V0_9ACTN|nr:aldo/keto reductase [Nakamurella aerolata]NNG35141.1 aldo/keto reductase [Nakamurella aerolata]